MQVSSGGSNQNITRDQKNFLIYLLYSKQKYKECLKVIDNVLNRCGDNCEYPLYIKGLIERYQGDIPSSLQKFQRLLSINSKHSQSQKQIAKSMFLMGKFPAAIDVYEEICKEDKDDWESYLHMATCYEYLNDHDKAIECIQIANDIQPSDIGYLQLAQMFGTKSDVEGSIKALEEGLENSPENPDLLVQLGLQYLKKDETDKAFAAFGSVLSQDPRNTKAILAAASIIQDHSDMDVALVKYRVALHQNPNNAQVWNNIGMCFFGKKKLVGAISCLKRAIYLAPFEWIIYYNLGITHLAAEMYVSAFNFLSSAVNLNPNFASSYCYLGVALANLNDIENSSAAYERALSIEKAPAFELNYAITLHRFGEIKRAKEHLLQFEILANITTATPIDNSAFPSSLPDSLDNDMKDAYSKLKLVYSE